MKLLPRPAPVCGCVAVVAGATGAALVPRLTPQEADERFAIGVVVEHRPPRRGDS